MSTSIERTRELLASLTPEQRADLVECLCDAYSAVRESNPHDDPARRSTDAARLVLRMTRSILAVGERPEAVRPRRVQRARGGPGAAVLYAAPTRARPAPPQSAQHSRCPRARQGRKGRLMSGGEYRIEYSIQHAVASGEDFTEVGFGSSGAWNDLDAALYALQSDIQNGAWETETRGHEDTKLTDAELLGQGGEGR